MDYSTVARVIAGLVSPRGKTTVLKRCSICGHTKSHCEHMAKFTREGGSPKDAHDFDPMGSAGDRILGTVEYLYKLGFEGFLQCCIDTDRTDARIERLEKREAERRAEKRLGNRLPADLES